MDLVRERLLLCCVPALLTAALTHAANADDLDAHEQRGAQRTADGQAGNPHALRDALPDQTASAR